MGKGDSPAHVDNGNDIHDIMASLPGEALSTSPYGHGQQENSLGSVQTLSVKFETLQHSNSSQLAPNGQLLGSHFGPNKLGPLQIYKRVPVPPSTDTLLGNE